MSEATGEPLKPKPVRIPPRSLERLHNLTPFRVFDCQKMGPGRVFLECVVVKASFTLSAGTLGLASSPANLHLSDGYHDVNEPSLSSLRHAGDLHIAKRGADVLVTGRASAPHGRPAARWPCSVSVLEGSRTLAHLDLVAFGPRAWQHSFTGWSLSEPAPCVDVPIRYELSYGGWYRRLRGGAIDIVKFHANPSGCGFVDRDALDRSRAYEAPRWETAGHPIDAMSGEYPLAGFGPIARMWRDRLRFGGTFDAAWERSAREAAAQGLAADYPADLDARYFQSAHPALQTASPIRSGTAFRLVGLLAESPDLVFRLPDIGLLVEALDTAGRWHLIDDPALDTVHVDLDARRVDVTWRVVLRPEQATVVIVDCAEGFHAQAHR